VTDSQPAPVRKMVFTIHGIRTRGEWQNKLGDMLSDNGFVTRTLDYDRFNIFQFLYPPSRKKKIDWLLEQYAIETRLSSEKPSIVAHSLGSWLVAEILRSHPAVKFDRIIFCGSIVRQDFPWSTCKKRGQLSYVLNDFATKDLPVLIAEYVVSTAGTSGRYGFDDVADGSVHQRRNPGFGHSSVFTEVNYRENWIPFLKGASPETLEPIELPPRNWKFIIVLAAFLALVLIGGYFLYQMIPVRADLNAPLTESEYPEVEEAELPSKDEVDAAAALPDEKFPVLIENRTDEPIQVVVYNCFKKYQEADFSSPSWSQLKVIPPGESEPANVRNLRSRLFAFFVRNETSGFQHLGNFDLREIRTLGVTHVDGTFEVDTQLIQGDH
jgi:pimeloyl-ACP methyl ester carboxylesterase